MEQRQDIVNQLKQLVGITIGGVFYAEKYQDIMRCETCNNERKVIARYGVYKTTIIGCPDCTPLTYVTRVRITPVEVISVKFAQGTCGTMRIRVHVRTDSYRIDDELSIEDLYTTRAELLKDYPDADVEDTVGDGDE